MSETKYNLTDLKFSLIFCGGSILYILNLLIISFSKSDGLTIGLLGSAMGLGVAPAVDIDISRISSPTMGTFSIRPTASFIVMSPEIVGLYMSS